MTKRGFGGDSTVTGFFVYGQYNKTSFNCCYGFSGGDGWFHRVGYVGIFENRFGQGWMLIGRFFHFSGWELSKVSPEFRGLGTSRHTAQRMPAQHIWACSGERGDWRMAQAFCVRAGWHAEGTRIFAAEL